MTSRTAVLFTLATGLLMGACDGSDPAGPAAKDSGQSDVAATVAAGGATMVPVEWTYDVTPADAQTVVCSNSDGSPPFLAISENWQTRGRVTHMGELQPEQSIVRFTSCEVSVIGGIPVSAIGWAVGRLVGANGDAIFLSGTDDLSFADFTAVGDWTITGGTGRFEGASGWIATFESVSPNGTDVVGGGPGMITPPGIAKHP